MSMREKMPVLLKYIAYYQLFLNVEMSCMATATAPGMDNPTYNALPKTNSEGKYCTFCR